MILDLKKSIQEGQAMGLNRKKGMRIMQNGVTSSWPKLLSIKKQGLIAAGSEGGGKNTKIGDNL